jgi:hypothetical protein
VAVAADRKQPRVGRLGCGRVHHLAGGRVDAIGAEQQTSLGLGAVDETGDHLVPAINLIGVQPLAEFEPRAAALRLLTQHPLQQAAPEGDADGAVPEPDTVGDLAEALACPAPHHHMRDREAVRPSSRIDIKGPQHVQAVGRHIQKQPHVVRRRLGGLVHSGLEAGTLQSDGGDGTADAAAHDEDSSVCHDGFLLVNPLPER